MFACDLGWNAPSRPEESPPLLTVEEIWKTASQVEPRLHLTPPCKTQPDFAMSDMVVAKANRQVKKKIYIFLPKKSHLSAVLARGTSSTSSIMSPLKEWRCMVRLKSMHNLSLHLTLQDQDYNIGWREADEGDQDRPSH